MQAQQALAAHLLRQISPAAAAACAVKPGQPNRRQLSVINSGLEQEPEELVEVHLLLHRAALSSHRVGVDGIRPQQLVSACLRPTSELLQAVDVFRSINGPG